MQQGDCNASAIMITGMNFLFSNIKHLMIYLHDILIANNNYEKHIKTMKEVMRIAEDHKV